MATNTRELNIKVTAKDDASVKLGKLDKKLQKIGPTFKKIAAASAVAFAAISVGASKAISLARDFEEETNKFGVVFKDVSKEAEQMAETLNKSYGLSRLESKRLLSSTGDILTGFGFTGEGALDLAGKVNTLAVDLASFTNAQGGAEAVSSALTKALLGERESLKTYGIAIQDADVQAGLLERGMDKLTGEALRQAKAQVTLDIAFKQSKNAVGDYSRSAGSLTQTQVELKKRIDDITITLGQRLAPILNEILKVIVKGIDTFNSFDQVVKVVKDNVSNLMQLLENKLGIITILKESWNNVVIVFEQRLLPKLKELWEVLKPLQPFLEILARLIGVVLYGALIAVVKIIETGLIVTMELLSLWMERIKGWIDAWNTGFDKFTTAISKVITKVDSLISKLKNLASLGGITSKVSGFLGFDGARATGGPVSGGKSYLVGERGPEIFSPSGSGKIIPNNKMNGGGGSVNIVINGDVTGNEIIEKIKSALMGELNINNRITI